jgi:hypothetical protein
MLSNQYIAGFLGRLVQIGVPKREESFAAHAKDCTLYGEWMEIPVSGQNIPFRNKF